MSAQAACMTSAGLMRKQRVHRPWIRASGHQAALAEGAEGVQAATPSAAPVLCANSAGIIDSVARQLTR